MSSLTVRLSTERLKADSCVMSVRQRRLRRIFTLRASKCHRVNHLHTGNGKRNVTSVLKTNQTSSEWNVLWWWVCSDVTATFQSAFNAPLSWSLILTRRGTPPASLWPCRTRWCRGSPYWLLLLAWNQSDQSAETFCNVWTFGLKLSCVSLSQ